MPRVAVMRGSAVLGQHGQGKMCQGAVSPRVMVGEREEAALICSDLEGYTCAMVGLPRTSLTLLPPAPRAVRVLQPTPACCTRAGGHCPSVLLWGLSPEPAAPWDPRKLPV